MTLNDTEPFPIPTEAKLTEMVCARISLALNATADIDEDLLKWLAHRSHGKTRLRHMLDKFSFGSGPQRCPDPNS